ncbi:MAG: GspE/PulE family protein [Mariprofundales bacterium]|nr:GspE/PulE family protein [Mariprofundales bacterium]
MADFTNRPQRKPLGERLIDQGLINRSQLELALREQKRLGGYVGEALIGLGFLSADALAEAMASETNTQVIDIGAAVIDPDVLKLVPHEMARRFHLIPYTVENDLLTVVMADPYDVVAIDTLEKQCHLQIEAASAPDGDVMEAIARNYMQGISIDDTMDKILRDGFVASEDEVGSAPLVRLVDQLIAEGVKQQATDIHIEPDEKIVRVRMRIDGVLKRSVLIPKPLQLAITARIKIMSGMNITEKRIPQDGRIRFPFGKREVDLRVSILPTAHGENIVMRLLDQGKMDLTLSSVGLSKTNAERFKRAIDRPHGVVLVTGPTGSGKTTTLYAALGEINSEGVSIFTLEDPIEYRIPLVRQTQINPEVGLTFASGLRALLRQDPDVILLGEIRDGETAELAVRASLTGHLVFSTLHTNDAVGAIPRLIDMGIEPYLLPACLAGIMAQRLVRSICPGCKQPMEDPRKELADAGVNLKPESNPQLWEGSGCESCGNTGYRGRVTINEVLLMDDKFHDAIVQGASVAELGRLAAANGMRSMFMDGIGKALQGLTTVSEVVRVSRAH